MQTELRGTPARRWEALRLQAVEAVLHGGPRAAVARRLGVTRQAVHAWLKQHRLHGPDGLAARGRGRTARPLLPPAEEAGIVATIAALSPREVGLPYSRWTRKAVAGLVEARHGFRASAWKLDRMLGRWGFRSQKEVRRAHRNLPPRVRDRIAAAGARATITKTIEENLHAE